MRAVGSFKLKERAQYGLFYLKDDLHEIWSMWASVFMGRCYWVSQSSLAKQGAAEQEPTAGRQNQEHASWK